MRYFMIKGMDTVNDKGVGFGVRPTGGLFLYNGAIVIDAGLLSLNLWQHVVATNDGTTTRIYINGELSNSSAHTIVNDPARSLWLGNRPDVPIFAFNGIIDEARVYNRALKAYEIQDKFVKGVESLYARGMITEDDFNNRMAQLESYLVIK